ncbi:hypothetical protein V1512DRAFT_243840 [Lipomyces arxii]|uniref:uncharacterized protein n=1 Tax=Lipomyces arxii TaxID=56418 RepID=UPI0034CD6204
MYSRLSRTKTRAFSDLSVAVPRHRLITTLPTNKQVYVHGNKLSVSRSPEAVYIGTVKDVESLEGFEPNSKFVALLHKTIGKYISHDGLFQSIAATYADNYMAIYDLRAPPVYGRIPEVQDIFGMVRVDGQGQMLDGTYEENTMYRIVTNDGICQFSDYMLKRIKKECEL